MSERSPQNKNNQPSRQKITATTAQERARLASQETMAQNPSDRHLMVAGKMIEAQIEMEASNRLQKARLLQQEAERTAKLHEPAKSMETIAKETEEARIDSARLEEERLTLEETLHNSMLNARETTLEMGRSVADELLESGKNPDTKILFPPEEPAKKQTKKKRFAKLRQKEAPKVKLHSKETSGWYVDGVSGQTERHTKVFLCEDGRILTARGKFLPKSEKDGRDKNTISIPGNIDREDFIQAGYTKGRTHRRVEIYSSFISKDDDFNSDLGLAPKSNSTITNHSIIMRREEELQKAIFNLKSK